MLRPLAWTEGGTYPRYRPFTRWFHICESSTNFGPTLP